MAKNEAFVHGKRVIDALIEAGIADANTTRVVLDIDVRSQVTVYVEKVGDRRVCSTWSRPSPRRVVRYADREARHG